MSITYEKIRLIRGDDEARQVILMWSDKTPYSLTQVARIDLHAKSQDKVVLNLSTENSLIKVINRDNGQLLLHIPHHLTQSAQWAEAKYDLQITFQDGRIKTVLYGMMTLIGDVTQLE